MSRDELTGFASGCFCFCVFMLIHGEVEGSEDKIPPRNPRREPRSLSSTEPVSVASTWGSFPRLPAHPLVCPAGSALPIFRQGQFQQVHPCAEALLCARRIARTLRPIPKPLHAAVVCCAGIPASRYTPPLQWALMPCCALTCSGRRSSTARLYPPSTNGNPLKGPLCREA